jgi:hypothetical protein
MRLLVLVLAAAMAPAPHPVEYWRAIAANHYDVPAGTTARELTPELVDDLGSPNSELRDDIAYSTLTAWIYQKKLLQPAELIDIARTLEANLANGIGNTQGDGVLRRSFSALTLSVIAARDNDAPFFDAAGYQRLLDAALTYFHDERDLRGFDAEKGWMHSAAHTSDLLKFLARSPKLRVPDQARILNALLAKNRDATSAFAQGEDERMARVAISIVRRADFDRDAFHAWLTSAAAGATFPTTVSVASLRAEQNTRHLLMALSTELSADERPSDGADFARAALETTLKTLF